MNRRSISRMADFGLGCLLVGMAWVEFDLPMACAERQSLQATDGLRWCRGNLHTHSHWSDGDDYLPTIAAWYRDHGYQFLVFTDHNVLAQSERWIDVDASKGGRRAFEKLKTKFPDTTQDRITDDGKLEVRLQTFAEVAAQLNKPGEFLLVQGEEISDSHDSLPIHLNAGNVAELIAPMQGNSVFDTVQNNVRAVNAQRQRTGQTMMVHVNHPNFGYAIPAEDLMRLRGEKFFEVYNGHPAVANAGDEQHAGTERMWDIILAQRLALLDLPVMYGLAVDDGHNYHEHNHHQSNPGRGWVMVLTKELSAESLIDAMEAGNFYSSTGVTLQRVAQTDENLSIAVEPVGDESYTIEFIGTRRGFDPASQAVVDDEGNELRATRRYSDEIGQVFKTVTGNSATYNFVGDEIYVRARITSSADHPNPGELDEKQRAWTQPMVLAKDSAKGGGSD